MLVARTTEVLHSYPSHIRFETDTLRYHQDRHPQKQFQVQIAHYVWSAVGGAGSSSSSSTSSTKSDIHFYVPTGAGGHVTAGVMARQMLREMKGTSETTKICYTFVDVPNPRDFSACV